jgi:hypothetical protein
MGIANEVMTIGDQINVNWSDGATDYVMPFDIVHFGGVTLQDGEVVPGMFLQSHYALPAGVQFDNYEAFYLAPDGLEAGTYNVTIAQNWGKIQGGDYQFTLTKAVPSGGCLTGFEKISSAENWTVKSFADMETNTPIETVTVAVGSEGAALGIMPYNKAGETVNSMYRTGFGYHRWSQSNIRQYLNSNADTGKWWTSQNVFDRAPSQLATMQGFMKGFSEDFLKILGKVKVTTALNTYEKFETDREDTYDTFFLPSLEQIYASPKLAGAEGEYWEYWKRALGLTSTAEINRAYEAYKTYALNSKSSLQSIQLRSASLGSLDIWSVLSTGVLGNYGPYNAIRCTPVCVVC